MNAVISPCGLYRYRLERGPFIQPLQEPADYGVPELRGKVIGFFGVNPSTADASIDDRTVKKWIGFCRRWGAQRFIVGNVFAYRSTDVNVLATVDDPFGDEIGDHTTDIINEADILVPCWGVISKVPPKLQFAFDVMLDALVSSGKPVLHFGLTKGGDPRHPLMLAYRTSLVPFER
jgi:hypothetical protein